VGRYVLRRLSQAVLTIFGVMLFSFLLFRVVAGDLAAQYAGEKTSEEYRQDWRRRHGYDRPFVFNVHGQLRLEDLTKGDGSFELKEVNTPEHYSRTGDVLVMPFAEKSDRVRLGRYIAFLSRDTAVSELTGNKPLAGVKKSAIDRVPDRAILKAELHNGRELAIDVTGAARVGELIDRVNDAPQNRDEATGEPLVRMSITDWSPADLFDAQFWPFLRQSATLEARSLDSNKKLTEIITERAPYSLALTVPSMAIGWVLAMAVACFVAYYRGRWIDHLGVFLSVLGMCVPFLAYMIIGRYIVDSIAGREAYGITTSRASIYIPIMIMVIAGLGASVRFYRTVILNETNQDYVRTARAKGAPVTTVLFKHVLKNSMLPILTNLILSIPFLIMGSLLVESYFGIPGLGDLLLTSFRSGDEPVLNALVFLSAVIYTVGMLLTDLTYAFFDPRIRLQ
jgi:peptide/nickel transport system permease protein